MTTKFNDDELEQMRDEYRKDEVMELEQSKKEAVIANWVDDFMGDINNEDAIIEIASNNEDCAEAIMNICSIKVTSDMVGHLTLNEVEALARASMRFIKCIEKHAEGYVEKEL